MRDPTSSPWGEVQDCDELCPGIFLVTTPGHGGIMVSPESAVCLSAAARKCGFRDGGNLWFEEDCQEQVVLRELLDKKLWEIPARVSDPAAFEKSLDRSIQTYQPEYWAAREKTSAPRKRSRPQFPVR